MRRYPVFVLAFLCFSFCCGEVFAQNHKKRALMRKYKRLKAKIEQKYKRFAKTDDTYGMTLSELEIMGGAYEGWAKNARRLPKRFETCRQFAQLVCASEKALVGKVKRKQSCEMVVLGRTKAKGWSDETCKNTALQVLSTTPSKVHTFLGQSFRVSPSAQADLRRNPAVPFHVYRYTSLEELVPFDWCREMAAFHLMMRDEARSLVKRNGSTMMAMQNESNLYMHLTIHLESTSAVLNLYLQTKNFNGEKVARESYGDVCKTAMHQAIEASHKDYQLDKKRRNTSAQKPPKSKWRISGLEGNSQDKDAAKGGASKPRLQGQVSHRKGSYSPSCNKTNVERGVKRGLGELKQCYDNALVSSPNLSGQAVVTWNIRPDGKVSNVLIPKSTLGTKALDDCLSRTVARWIFSRPKSTCTVAVPLFFSN